MMRKICLLALMAIVLPLMAWSQFTISGKVLSQAEKQALAGASVAVAGQTAQTDVSGNFNFQNLQAGRYTLKVSYLGFQAYSKIINLTRDERLTVELSPVDFVTEDVIVQATRASKTSPTTFRNVGRAELEKNNLGQDLPYLLNQTPSVVVSSDAGNGVGYTGIRIRGSDPTRINVTINGIPYNDPESHGTFLVNLPDFASSVDNIQIQRGVGTSTNGAGAFGGSLNVQTTTRRDSAYAELNNSVGSFETVKNTVNLGTGLINGKFTLDGRLSRIKSDGYIERASSNLKSYFLSGGFYGKKDLLKVNVFSGTEKTYQAWNGVPESMLTTNRRYNYFTYDDQTDNYTQDHYQIHYTRTLSDNLSATLAGHYTWGRGYYEEFKEGEKLQKYNIEPVVIGGETITTSDIIRRRALDNDFYGLTYSLNYKPSSVLNLTLGGGYNEYDGKHYGEVIWARFSSTSNIRDRYYDNDGFKTDFNIYGRADYQIGKANLYADLQYRGVGYSFVGLDRNGNDLQQKVNLDFFNPKVGITYALDNRSNVYLSFAVANKEPNRDDFTESSPASRPKHEALNNLEFGYRRAGSKISGGINAYGMFYRNQLILTGRVNDVGAYTRENVRDSYRVGLELDGSWRITEQLLWRATAALSRNKIKNFVTYIDSEVDGIYRRPDISFSPSFIGSSEISWSPVKNGDIAFLSKYVGRQYLDNTQSKERQIDAFFVNDLRLAYNRPLLNAKNVGLTLLVNNLFGEIYENNGYVYGENYYFTQAGRNFLVGLNLKF